MLDTDNSVLVIIDIQDKLIKASFSSESIVSDAIKLAKACNILSIPVIVTEQYPKGLGQTAEELKNILSNDTVFIEKTSFSATDEPEFAEKIKSTKRKQVIICGIETHICVLQTALNLIKEGNEVYVVKECCSSRNIDEHNTALELLKQYGAKIVTVEIALFQWLKTSKHPHFKEIQTLIK